MLLKPLRFYLWIGLFCLLIPEASASHLLGGNFRFESLNSCTTRVYLDLYFDCTSSLFNPPNFPAAPTPNQIQVSADTFCAPPVPLTAWTGFSMQDVTPVCPSVPNTCNDPNAAVYGTYIVTYMADYDVCFAACPANIYYTFQYENCCRNNSLVNGGAGSGIHISGLLEANPSLSNNSPVFNGPPTSILCMGQGGMIDMSAYDADGDSLWYQLTFCYANANQLIPYNPGFSGTQPFGSMFTTNFDSQTGLMSVIPNPGAIGSYQICVTVNESRNGQYLGSVTRDFQVQVDNCPSGVGALPVFDGLQNVSNASMPGPNNLVVCEGQTVSFDIAFSDADAMDNILVSSNVTTVLDSSTFISAGANPAQGVVTWTPGPDNAGQTYTFYATATSAGCPVPGTHTEVFYVSVGGQCLNAVVSNTACNDSTGAIDITVNASNPPFTYLWSNGATTEDISGLPIGQYWVDVSNASGLLISDTFYVSASNINLNPIVNSLDCDNPIGAIGVNPSGGTAPYTYQWSNGTTGQAIGALSAGGYSVIVTDAIGCFAQQTFILDPPDSCFVLVEGTVYHDQNNNCIQDANENGIPFMVVDIAPGWATLTDAQGHYSLQADTGNVVVSVMPAPFSSPLCPVSGSTSLTFSSYDEDTTGIDFAMDFQSVQDLLVNHTAGVAVPGLSRYHYVTATNLGNVPMSGTVSANYAPVEVLTAVINPAPSLNDPSNQLLEWSYGPLAPGASAVFTFFTSVDTAAIPGDTAKTYVVVNPIAGDTTPANNYDTTCVEILAAYDPNDKQVSPIGVVAPATGQGGYILPSENLMEYTVRFQNTGNYPAQYVVIRDTLDSDLNAMSFRAAGASHPYSLNFEDDSVLVFTFANINLPDSASDPLGSQGFVAFSLQHAGSLSPGSQIENRAAIYFDYNAPIITNTVQNTIFTYPEVAMDPLTFDYLCFPYELMAQLSVLGTSPYTYNWNTGTQGQNTNGTFSTPIDSSRFYTLTVTDALGFETVDSAYWEVRNVPEAIIEVVSASGYTVQLNSPDQNATSQIWDFGDGSPQDTSQNPTHTYAFDGSYTITLIVNNDCGSDTTTIFDPLSLAIDNEFARSIKVVPNPFTVQTQIRFENPQAKAYALKIYDLHGKMVREYESSRGDHFTIDRGELSTGMYMYQLVGQEHSHTGKLILQ
ncbi:MAG: PKD domain-containing protein [Bacteroidota bacterium]